MSTENKVSEFFDKQVRFNTLAYIWIDRIVFAKPHFKVPFLKKIKLNLHGYVGDQYTLFDLENHSTDEYLSEFDWWKSRYINENYRYVLNNKLVCNDMLEPFIRVPHVYASCPHKIIMDNRGKEISIEDLLTIIAEKEKCIIKPIESGKGKNVFLLSYQNGQYYVDGKMKNVAEMKKLLTSFSNWFVSEYIQQAQYLNQIYEKTTNTIRLITLWHDSKLCIPAAVQRIGTEKTIPVDNGSRGGLIANIDLESGALSVAKSMHELGEWKVHPDSGTQLEGYVIPNWTELKSQILSVAVRFPYLRFIAWDILVTEEGPCIVEANASSGINILQLWGGQKQKLLGDFYRENGIIK